MTARHFWLAWLFFGILVGAGLTGEAILVIIAVVAVAPLAALAVLRIPGFWMGVAGLGLGYGAASWLIASPEASGDAARSIVLGLIVAAIGLAIFFRARASADTYVPQRRLWIPWFVFGFVVGGGLWSPGIAFFIAIAALGSLSVLALLRVPGFWMGVAGAGTGFSVTWASLLIDPNAPDDALWPLAPGLLIAAIGFTLFRRRHTSVAPPA